MTFTPTVGASRAQLLADGALPELWAELTGRAERDNLSGNLPVLMGSALEPLHVAWFARQTGIPVTDEQLKVSDPALGLHATLDGQVVVPGIGRCAWEAKTTGPRTLMTHMLVRTHCQLAVQALMARTQHVVLSVLWRTPAWDCRLVTPDAALTDELVERAAILRFHLLRDSEPPRLPPCPVPLPEAQPLPLPSPVSTPEKETV